MAKHLTQSEKDFIALNCTYLKDQELADILTVMTGYPRTAGAVRKMRCQMQVKRKEKRQIYILLPRNSYDEYKKLIDSTPFLNDSV